jgi:hypothetical protein
MSYSCQRWILDHWMLDGCRFRKSQRVKLQQSKSLHRVRRHYEISIKSFVLKRLSSSAITSHATVAVQAFLGCQEIKRKGETRKSIALSVARCFRKGVYFARKIVSWEAVDSDIEKLR